MNLGCIYQSQRYGFAPPNWYFRGAPCVEFGVHLGVMLGWPPCFCAYLGRPPAASLRPPASGRQPPASGLRLPISGLQPRPPASGLRPAASGLRPPVSGLRPPAFNLRPPAFGLRPPASGLRPLASGPSSGLRPPAFRLRPSAGGRNIHCRDRPPGLGAGGVGRRMGVGLRTGGGQGGGLATRGAGDWARGLGAGTESVLSQFLWRSQF